MFPIISPVTMNMPELAQAGSLTRLPWPDGSVVSAKLMPTETPGNALLILGSYRLLAQVPPATPMGDVWLMLVSRQIPARFTVMSEAQVVQMLAGMLEAEQNQPAKGAPGQHHAAKNAAHASIASALSGDHSDWPNLSTPQRHDGRQAVPWNGETAADGHTLLWYDKQDEQPRGMLHRKIEREYFTLSGRVDLDHLGIVSFNLRGGVNHAASGEHAATAGDDDSTGNTRGWQLNLQAQPGRALNNLRQSFDEWMAEQAESFPDVRAEISAGLPEEGSGGLTERTA